MAHKNATAGAGDPGDRQAFVEGNRPAKPKAIGQSKQAVQIDNPILADHAEEIRRLGKQTII
jgi:hypothetical protein